MSHVEIRKEVYFSTEFHRNKFDQTTRNYFKAQKDLQLQSFHLEKRFRFRLFKEESLQITPIEGPEGDPKTA